MESVERLMMEAYDEGVVSQVIRPAAIVPEDAVRRILVELALRDVRNGGVWQSEPQLWSLFDRPWRGADNPAGAELIGSIQVAYGTPTKYEITIYRITVTRFGTEAGFTVETMTDAALLFGGLTLAECPRATLSSPPQPFKY